MSLQFLGVGPARHEASGFARVRLQVEELFSDLPLGIDDVFVSVSPQHPPFQPVALPEAAELRFNDYELSRRIEGTPVCAGSEAPAGEFGRRCDSAVIADGWHEVQAG